MRAALGRPLLAAVTIGSLIAAAGCGGTSPKSAAAPSKTPTASPSASATPVPGSQQPAQAPPAGYQWVGNPSQAIWLAVPKTWVALNLSHLSLSQALKRVSLKGVSTAAMRANLTSLKQHDALFIADLTSASTSPNQFATNVNAFCSPEVIEPGLGAVSVLDKALRVEYDKIHARVLSLKNAQASNTAVIIDVELALQATAGYTLTELQVIDLTNQSSICEVTLSTDNPAKYLGTLKRISSTVHAG